MQYCAFSHLGNGLSYECTILVNIINNVFFQQVFLKETQSSLLVTDEFITGPLQVHNNKTL